MLELDMKNRVVLITGASGELGRVMARKFADCNADVIIHYNRRIYPRKRRKSHARDLKFFLAIPLHLC